MTKEEIPADTDLTLPMGREQKFGGADPAQSNDGVLRAGQPPTEPERWQDDLLARLHQLSPDRFEEFVLYMLQAYGIRVEHSYRSEDGRIDAVGTFPLSAVLDSRVAFQVERGTLERLPIDQEVVARFQRDAKDKGADRAILVTLGEFSRPAYSATIVTSPAVDLIDGDHLANLVRLGIHTENHTASDSLNRALGIIGGE